MLANAKKMVTSLTEVAIALLALAIVASVLVGPDNMAFLGDVVGNITARASSGSSVTVTVAPAVTAGSLSLWCRPFPADIR